MFFYERGTPVKVLKAYWHNDTYHPVALRQGYQRAWDHLAVIRDYRGTLLYEGAVSYGRGTPVGLPTSVGSPWCHQGLQCTGVTRNEGHAPPLGWSYAPRHTPTVGP